MFRRLILAVAALALLLGGLSIMPAQADDWKPKAGVSFNKPRNGVKARSRLIRKVIAGIEHAPKKSTIRFAIYSFDRKDVANALLKARKRVYAVTPIRFRWRARTGVVGGLAEPARRAGGANRTLKE